MNKRILLLTFFLLANENSLLKAGFWTSLAANPLVQRTVAKVSENPKVACALGALAFSTFMYQKYKSNNKHNYIYALVDDAQDNYKITFVDEFKFNKYKSSYLSVSYEGLVQHAPEFIQEASKELTKNNADKDNIKKREKLKNEYSDALDKECEFYGLKGFGRYHGLFEDIKYKKPPESFEYYTKKCCDARKAYEQACEKQTSIEVPKPQPVERLGVKDIPAVIDGLFVQPVKNSVVSSLETVTNVCETVGSTILSVPGYTTNLLGCKKVSEGKSSANDNPPLSLHNRA